MAIFLVSLYDYPLECTIMTTLLNFAIVVSPIKALPYQDKVMNIKAIAQEFVFTIMTLLIAVMTGNIDNYSQTVKIDEGIFALGWMMVLINVIAIIIAQISGWKLIGNQKLQRMRFILGLNLSCFSEYFFIIHIQYLNMNIAQFMTFHQCNFRNKTSLHFE